MAAEFTHEFFELSSSVWNLNKVRRGHMYYYKCTGRFKTGRPCNRVCLGSSEFCKLHTVSSRLSAAPFAKILTSRASALVDLDLRTSDNVV